jgi:outer membrane protein
VKLVVGVVVLALATRAEAEPAVRVMTLREAIAYARTHHPSLEAARGRVAVARAQVNLPRALRSPRIVGAGELLIGTNNNTTASFGGIGFVPRIGGTPANAPVEWKPEPSTLVGVGLYQQVYDFGRISKQVEALELFARAAEDDAQLADLDLALLIQDSFYAVAGAHAVLRAAEGAVRRATAHRDLAKAGVDAKLRPPIELTRAEADLTRFEVDTIRARGALTTAQAVLAAVIGAPDAAIDAGADDLAYPTFPALATTVGELDRRDPAIRAARHALFGQQQLTHAIEAELRPDLLLVAGATGRAGGSEVANNPTPTGGGWLPSVPNWNAFLLLSWPIFDRTISARAEVSRRLERVRAADLELVRQRLRGRAVEVYTDFDVAQRTVPALERAVDAARSNQDQAEARFKSGLATAIEVADSQALLTDAEIQLAIGKYRLARARARLARVIAEEIR